MKGATGQTIDAESLGGARTHTEVSAVAHYRAANDPECLERIRQYIARLPRRKLPDRSDFKRFAGDDAGRMKYWRAAIAESGRLAEAFSEFVLRPDATRIQPL